MHALALLSINQQKKFEMPSFTMSKNRIVAKNVKKTGHVTLTTPFSGVVCYP